MIQSTRRKWQFTILASALTANVKLGLALAFALVSAQVCAAPKKITPPHLEPALKKKFIAACSQAFLAPSSKTASDPERARGLSRAVCECAADETKSQGASDQAVRLESDAILKDPRHEIKDQHVLDALRYCAIQAFHGNDDDGS